MNNGQLNRAFRYGDAVFETIRVQNGKPFNLPYHQNRLASALAALRIECAFDLAEIATKSALTNGFLRVQVTRDAASKGYLPLGNNGTITVEIIEGLEKPKDFAKLYISNIPQNLFIQAKTANSLHYVMAAIEANDNGCDNAILLDRDENICECASGNIFWVTNGTIFTPALDAQLIPGSAQNFIMQNFKVEQVLAKPTALLHADEVFMSNVNVIAQSIGEILPLNKKYTSNKTQQEIWAALK